VDSVSFFKNSISENREIVPRRRWLPKPSSKYWRYSFWNIYKKGEFNRESVTLGLR
tara:strand:- start:1277 stop:1444 length:168 start_codon:yes stop_codon:yes gene_type:complete